MRKVNAITRSQINLTRGSIHVFSRDQPLPLCVSYNVQHRRFPRQLLAADYRRYTDCRLLRRIFKGDYRDIHKGQHLLHTFPYSYWFISFTQLLQLHILIHIHFQYIQSTIIHHQTYCSRLNLHVMINAPLNVLQCKLNCANIQFACIND